MSTEEKGWFPLLLALTAKDSPSKTRSLARVAHTLAALSRVGSVVNAGEVETIPKTSAAASAARKSLVSMNIRPHSLRIWNMEYLENPALPQYSS